MVCPLGVVNVSVCCDTVVSDKVVISNVDEAKVSFSVTVSPVVYLSIDVVLSGPSVAGVNSVVSVFIVTCFVLDAIVVVELASDVVSCSVVGRVNSVLLSWDVTSSFGNLVVGSVEVSIGVVSILSELSGFVVDFSTGLNVVSKSTCSSVDVPRVGAVTIESPVVWEYGDDSTGAIVSVVSARSVTVIVVSDGVASNLSVETIGTDVGETEVVTSVVLSCVVTSSRVVDSTVVKLVVNDSVDCSTDVIVSVVSAPSVTDTVVTDGVVSNLSVTRLVIDRVVVSTVVAEINRYEMNSLKKNKRGTSISVIRFTIKVLFKKD